MLTGEALTQSQCVEWFRAEYPAALLVYINNNSSSVRQGRKNKLLGVKAGMCDLVLFHKSGKYSGLCIEMKAAGKHPTPRQAAIHDLLRRQGFLVVVLTSLEAFQQVCRSYMGGET